MYSRGEENRMGRPRSFDADTTLRAISDRFWDTGYSATSVDDLMQCTGLGKGSLYGAFGSKHEMFVRILRLYAEQVAAEWEHALAGDDAGAYDRLHTFLTASAEMMAGSVRGCLLAKAVSELAGHDEEVESIVRATFDRMEGALRRCVTQAQRAGALADSANPERVATLLFAMVRGVDALVRAGATSVTTRAVAEDALTLVRANAGAAA